MLTFLKTARTSHSASPAIIDCPSTQESQWNGAAHSGMIESPTRVGTTKIFSLQPSAKGAGLYITVVDANEIIGQLNLSFHPLVLLPGDLIHDNISYRDIILI